MAQRTVYDCDRCGKKNIEIRKISVIVDRKADGAGSMEDLIEAVDLCITCLEKELGLLVDKLSHECGRTWVNAVRKMRDSR